MSSGRGKPNYVEFNKTLIVWKQAIVEAEAVAVKEEIEVEALQEEADHPIEVASICDHSGMHDTKMFFRWPTAQG